LLVLLVLNEALLYHLLLMVMMLVLQVILHLHLLFMMLLVTCPIWVWRHVLTSRHLGKGQLVVLMVRVHRGLSCHIR
jgi:hypothetical protein